MPAPSTDSMPASRQQPDIKDEHDDEYGDAEKNFKPKTLKFWVIMLSMYAALFLVALDRLIIATAIPSITNEFASIKDIGWYGSAYMLTAAIFEPLFGRVYKLYSTKWVYIGSLVVFEAGSALCGAAPSSAAFIVGRAIAGIGAAGIFCGGIMIMLPLIPLRKRPIFTSFFGLAFGISSVLGPLIGGSFTDNSKLTWRWCFYINLPIGACTFVAMILFLHLESPKRERLSLFDQFKQLDPLGCLFLVPSMVCLILALQWGGTTYPWSAPKIIGLLVTFGVTFLLFLVVEFYTPETAMAPRHIVLNRSVGSSMLYMFLLSGGMMVMVYYLSIWFQAAQGQSAVEAGIRTIPLMLSLIVCGIAAGIVTQKTGYYVPALLVAPILYAVGGGMLSTLTPSSGSNQWIGYQVIFGLGIGFGFQTSTLVPQSVLSRTDVPLGTALMFFMQQLGGSVFVPVGQNLFSNQLVSRLVGMADLNATAIVDTGATALREAVPPDELDAVVNAYSFALTRSFILAAALGACMLVPALAIEWKNIKGKKGQDGKEVEAGPEEVTEKVKS